MSKTVFLKMVVLLSFSLLATACGEDEKNNDKCDAKYVASCDGNATLVCQDGKIVKTDCGAKTCDAGVCVEPQVEACDATFTATCVGNVAQTCVDKKIVKADCGTKTCDAGVCVEPQVEACDATFTATCVGNVAQTCVDKKIVKADCGTKTCKAGVCQDGSSTDPAKGKACTKDACLGNTLFECRGKVYDAGIACDSGYACSIDKSGIGGCLEICTVADKGKKKTVCGYDEGSPYTLGLICGIDNLGKYVYNEDPDFEYEDCPASCQDGKCVKLTTDDGAPCNEKSFAERCENDLVVYCDERFDWDEFEAINVVTVIRCDPAYTCQKQKNKNYADCVQPCTKGDAIKGECEAESDGTFSLYTDECVEALNASYYYFFQDALYDCKTCDPKTLTCK